jgi:toxin CcdB
MARFDVFVRADGGPGYLLDCQADLLSHLNTRFVVPLLPMGAAPRPAARLNPVFEILGAPHLMVTQFAAAVLSKELGGKVTSLSEQDTVIINALDMLISGV